MINTTYFLGLFFIFLRVTAFFGISNVFFPKGTPNKLKVLFSLIFSVALLSGVDYSNINNITSNYYLINYMISEISTGLILGLITNISFEIVVMAGSLLDLHIGLSMVNVVDPNSKANTTISGNLLHYIAVMIFFVVNGHHIILKSLIESYKLLSMGTSILNQENMMVLISIIIQYFIIGLKIAIPIIIVILMTDIAMGLVSRAVPQINVMILGMPVKMLVGIISIAIFLPIIVKVFKSNISYLPDIYRKIITIFPLVFIIGNDEKTEEATPKKKSDSREKGQLPRTKDIGLAITLIATILAVSVFAGTIVTGLKENIVYFINAINNMDFSNGNLQKITLISLSRFAKALLPIILPIMIAGVVGSLMQSGFLVVKDAIKPSFGKLNPISGFKNMFSKKTFIELLKNLITISIIIYIAYIYIRDNFDKILQIGNLYLPTLGIEVKSLILGVFNKVAIVVVAIAAIDYLIQYRLHVKEIRMSKQEIKEEYKQMEGDPQIKSKIKQKQRQMSQRRMMDSVGDATVVITNPTHLAIAIKYEEGKTEAPKVVAKGADNIAIKIKEKAKETKVPIIENKPLARMIYEQVDIDQEIPNDMYQAVAEILAMVYKLNKKNKPTR